MSMTKEEFIYLFIAFLVISLTLLGMTASEYILARAAFVCSWFLAWPMIIDPPA